jgi:uncharacterized protein YggE
MKWAVAAAVLAVIGLSACHRDENQVAPGEIQFRPRFIRVYGEGVAVYAPNAARFQITVSDKKPTSTEAVNSAAQKAAALTAALQPLKTDAIRFVGPALTVAPYYELQEDKDKHLEEVRHPDKILGYVADISYSIEVYDLAQLGALISKVTQVGVDKFAGPDFFDNGKAEEAEKAAYQAAITDATEKAKTYAAKSGAKLGGLLRVDEAEQSSPQYAQTTQEIAVTARRREDSSRLLSTVQLPSDPPLDEERLRLLVVYQIAD